MNRDAARLRDRVRFWSVAHEIPLEARGRPRGQDTVRVPMWRFPSWRPVVSVVRTIVSFCFWFDRHTYQNCYDWFIVPCVTITSCICGGIDTDGLLQLRGSRFPSWSRKCSKVSWFDRRPPCLLAPAPPSSVFEKKGSHQIMVAAWWNFHRVSTTLYGQKCLVTSRFERPTTYILDSLRVR